MKSFKHTSTHPLQHLAGVFFIPFGTVLLENSFAAKPIREEKEEEGETHE